MIVGTHTPFALLGVGGVLYTIGAAFHLCRRSPYRNAVWHALVPAAAGCHYLAVLDVLARGRT